MPSDSGFVSVGSKKRDSSIQWTPQHSLSLTSSVSFPMSKHLHTTTRRIFIGPTPLNWSYKKSSFWFSKSEQATHHKGPNRQKTFRAESEVKGPTNMSSLDYYGVSDNPALTRITDQPFIVSEPEELSIDHGSSSSLFENEIFYTPIEEIHSYPITPPYRKRKRSYFHPIPEVPTHENSLNTQPTSPEGVATVYNVTGWKNHTDAFSDVQYSMNGSGGASHKTTQQTSDGFMNKNDVDHIPSSSESSHLNTNEIHNNNEIENIHKDNIESLSISDRSVQFAEEPLPVHEPGTIIKEGRVLIRLEHLYRQGTLKHNDGRFLKSHDNRKYIAQSVGWKEYNIILRPGILELYGRKKNRFAKLKLSNKVRLSIFSTIDYTLTLSKQTNYGKKVFLMNPKTIEQSIEWYRELYSLLGAPSIKPMPSVCEVYVPDLDVHVKIPLEKYSHAYQITVEDVTSLVLDTLSGEPEWDDFLSEWLKYCDLRLCWKRYDRIEWIVWENNEEGKVRNDLLACPQFIEGTHQLQLWSTKHYPTSVNLRDGTKLFEPPPVEGYLIRNTNSKGKWKPKRLYFTSHDHYLFFLKPFKTSPPPPPPSPNSSFIQPLIYAIAPQSQEQCAQTDAYMKADMKRRVKQIVNATAFINLLDVTEVKDVENGPRTVEMNNHGCPFELVLNNGTSVILQAYSEQTKDEWIKRLNELIKYWKTRILLDIQIRTNMYHENEDYNNEIDDNTSQDECYHCRWNVFQAYVDPTIWNWCVINGCRGITKRGLFYNKSHIHGTFRNYHHILTRGTLLYYDLYTYKLLNGVARRQRFHKRCGSINLAECYVYSGSITEYDVLYSSSSRFSATNERTHKLPRIYSDGTCCFDNDEECTFVIWQGAKRHCFEKDEKKNLHIKKKSMLDYPGNFWVFRTRSRIEREEWVWAINVEIERACKEIEKNKS